MASRVASRLAVCACLSLWPEAWARGRQTACTPARPGTRRCTRLAWRHVPSGTINVTGGAPAGLGRAPLVDRNGAGAGKEQERGSVRFAAHHVIGGMVAPAQAKARALQAQHGQHPRAVRLAHFVTVGHDHQLGRDAHGGEHVAGAQIRVQPAARAAQRIERRVFACGFALELSPSDLHWPAMPMLTWLPLLLLSAQLPNPDAIRAQNRRAHRWSAGHGRGLANRRRDHPPGRKQAGRSLP